MIGVVIAAHEHLAEAILKAAESVLGEIPNMNAISIDPTDQASQIQNKFLRSIEEVKNYGGILILTDMFGGTPANIALTLHKEKQIEVITGVNLPMIIKAAQLSQNEVDIKEAAKAIKDTGLRAITVASDLLSTSDTEGK